MSKQQPINGAEDFIAKKQTSLDKLCAFMASGNNSMVTDHNGKQYVGRITGIVMEDGSGRCWNVYLTLANVQMVMFTRFK